MKRHLNTLFVTTQGAYLAKDREAVAVRVEKQVKLHVPIHNLDGIVCFGKVSCSPALLGLCGQRGVTVTLLSIYGRFLARILGPTSGNVLLRREQYRRNDDEAASAGIARALVVAKVANCRSVLQRAARDHGSSGGRAALSDAADRLASLLTELGRSPRGDREGETESSESPTPAPDGDATHPLDVIRGLEGMAARIYFEVFDHLIVQQKEGFRFEGRSRRPPTDAINALLSFLYTLLMHDVRSALEGVGLDPAVGFLHRDRPGRPSLALDLMEELRPSFADRLALSLINRRQVQPEGFKVEESGGVRMDEATRRTVIEAYQQRKEAQLEHPFLEEKTTLGLVPHLQALLFSRYLRGDLDGYPPFVMH